MNLMKNITIKSINFECFNLETAKDLLKDGWCVKTIHYLLMPLFEAFICPTYETFEIPLPLLR